MALSHRPLARAARSVATSASRQNSTSAGPSTAPLRASLILSRPPLLTASLTPLEQTYYDYNFRLRHALSNPIPEDFYFREGSLPHRRWRQANWEHDTELYGPVIAGKEPNVGDIPIEKPIEPVPRDQWEKADAARGEKSLERKPEEEVFCLVQSKDGQSWDFPQVELREGELLHEAVQRITGVEGYMDGNTMDTWLVTRKPIGVTKNGEQRTFYLRGHILAGEPRLTKEAPWKTHAWLTQSELEAKLQQQNKWEGVSRIFGVPKPRDAEAQAQAEAETPATATA